MKVHRSLRRCFALGSSAVASKSVRMLPVTRPCSVRQNCQFVTGYQGGWVYVPKRRYRKDVPMMVKRHLSEV